MYLYIMYILTMQTEGFVVGGGGDGREHCLLLPPFHNVSHSSISHIHINVNESRHIFLFKFINININMRNVRITYIVKRRK